MDLEFYFLPSFFGAKKEDYIKPDMLDFYMQARFYTKEHSETHFFLYQKSAVEPRIPPLHYV